VAFWGFAAAFFRPADVAGFAAAFFRPADVAGFAAAFFLADLAGCVCSSGSCSRSPAIMGSVGVAGASTRATGTDSDAYSGPKALAIAVRYPASFRSFRIKAIRHFVLHVRACDRFG
jgi:hypothetical protein